MGKYDAVFIARYIVDFSLYTKRHITNLQLQKLLYFLWIDYYKKEHTVLFSNNIFAWQLGPVVLDVYDEYKIFGSDKITKSLGKSDEFLPLGDRITINSILKKYIFKSAYELVEMAHDRNGAWFEIYNEGLGKGYVIPFGLIVNKGR